MERETSAGVAAARALAVFALLLLAVAVGWGYVPGGVCGSVFAHHSFDSEVGVCVPRDWGNYLTEVVVFGTLGVVLLAVAVMLLVRFRRPRAA